MLGIIFVIGLFIDIILRIIIYNQNIYLDKYNVEIIKQHEEIKKEHEQIKIDDKKIYDLVKELISND